jgi:hypothetical protein
MVVLSGTEVALAVKLVRHRGGWSIVQLVTGVGEADGGTAVALGAGVAVGAKGQAAPDWVAL